MVVETFWTNNCLMGWTPPSFTKSTYPDIPPDPPLWSRLSEPSEALSPRLQSSFCPQIKLNLQLLHCKSFFFFFFFFLRSAHSWTWTWSQSHWAGCSQSIAHKKAWQIQTVCFLHDSRREHFFNTYITTYLIHYLSHNYTYSGSCSAESNSLRPRGL